MMNSQERLTCNSPLVNKSGNLDTLLSYEYTVKSWFLGGFGAGIRIGWRKKSYWCQVRNSRLLTVSITGKRWLLANFLLWTNFCRLPGDTPEKLDYPFEYTRETITSTNYFTNIGVNLKSFFSVAHEPGGLPQKKGKVGYFLDHYQVWNSNDCINWKCKNW